MELDSSRVSRRALGLKNFKAVESVSAYDNIVIDRNKFIQEEALSSKFQT